MGRQNGRKLLNNGAQLGTVAIPGCTARCCRRTRALRHATTESRATLWRTRLALLQPSQRRTCRAPVRRARSVTGVEPLHSRRGHLTGTFCRSARPSPPVKSRRGRTRLPTTTGRLALAPSGHFRVPMRRSAFQRHQSVRACVGGGTRRTRGRRLMGRILCRGGPTTYGTTAMATNGLPGEPTTEE